jgi:anti-sigma-K factor RskA
MNHKQAQELLHDYVDGILSASQAAGFESHLQECESCRSEVEQVRDLLKRAAALPQSIEPGRDLWPGIAARTRPASRERKSGTLRRFRRIAGSWRGFWTPVAATAAAAALIVIALQMRGPEPGDLPAEDVAASSSAVAQPSSAAVIEALEAECRLADQELAHYMPEASGETGDESSGIFGVFADNLRTINAAIDEARDAWLSDPDSPHLARLLAAAYRAKVALQGQAIQVVGHT